MPNPSPTGELDAFDLKIVDALVADGRISITDLAEKVGLSKTPCQVRLKRLMAQGYITGFRANLDPQKFGLDHIAFAASDLPGVRKRLQSKNVKFREQIVPRTGAAPR